MKAPSGTSVTPAGWFSKPEYKYKEGGPGSLCSNVGKRQVKLTRHRLFHQTWKKRPTDSKKMMLELLRLKVTLPKMYDGRGQKGCSHSTCFFLYIWSRGHTKCNTGFPTSINDLPVLQTALRGNTGKKSKARNSNTKKKQ